MTLSVVEKCPHYAPAKHVHDCIGGCHGTGTIKRKLTPEEMNETADDLAREYFTVHDTDFLTLASGLKVILVEGDDGNKI